MTINFLVPRDSFPIAVNYLDRFLSLLVRLGTFDDFGTEKVLDWQAMVGVVG
jgi:hypothetical protein